jgi:endoglucanase
VLLPGARGFERRDHVILNPSYYAFPALRVLARGVPDPAWLHVAADGLALLRRARFGRWGLPPDWLALARSDGRLSLPNGYAPRFSYDAVRVPLYLAWSGLTGEPGLTSAAAFWADPGHGHLPAWTDLTNNAVSPYPASGGISAIARLAIRAQQGGQRETAAERPAGTAGRPAVGTAPAPDYYSAALAALARFAGHDAMQQPA